MVTRHRRLGDVMEIHASSVVAATGKVRVESGGGVVVVHRVGGVAFEMGIEVAAGRVIARVGRRVISIDAQADRRHRVRVHDVVVVDVECAACVAVRPGMVAQLMRVEAAAMVAVQRGLDVMPVISAVTSEAVVGAGDVLGLVVVVVVLMGVFHGVVGRGEHGGRAGGSPRTRRRSRRECRGERVVVVERWRLLRGKDG